ncbi:DUF47 domain-containing protein [Actinomyces glycerinitolerans]|uniref:Putative phosphate transport regulator n=1 Tax=Actinomyces glycerinitolerans TaxID=1892869 RepID=A0A1M4S1U2_9ACTO|nr:DUF47 family protein [Actinomyces glycerinitolerans]SHE26172.1 putative phosphate transport regulator [Actinomyces glycerinitolerans]
MARLWTWLRRPGRRQTLVGALSAQATLAIEGVEFALRACEADADLDALVERIEQVERQGDTTRLQFVHLLSTRVVTPLDREDMFRFSRCLDEVLTNTRDFVRETRAWQIQPDDHSRTGLEHIRRGLEQLVGAMDTSSGRINRELCTAARKEGRRVREQYDDGLRQLFVEELNMEALARRELLRRVDVIGLRLIEAIDAVVDGIVKRTI